MPRLYAATKQSIQESIPGVDALDDSHSWAGRLGLDTGSRKHPLKWI